ncbi:MAG: efflux transporter outer membrane subunit [Deltaproteobacteria bacterium]|nr:efflux transporter outer membrane subunit [Deltaproteobacteria bacterium]
MMQEVFPKKTGRIFYLLFGVLFFLSGCISVGPDYIRKHPKVPQNWHTRLEFGLIAGSMKPEILSRWWKTFKDDELISLEKRALKTNLDLKDALARIREARARRGISKAGFFPSLDSNDSAKKHKISENSGTGKIVKLYSLGFDSDWELDIFGGVRRSVEAYQAELEAAKEGLHDVMVSLLAEVARNYIEVRTYQNRLTSLEKNIQVQKEIYSLNLSKYRAGTIDRLPLEESLYNLEQTRSRLSALQTGLEEAKHRIAVLLGESPGMVHKELSVCKPIPVPPETIVVGVPAETLRQRPDIRKAERELAAQTARIGVATADLYPKFRLNGTLGLESVSTGNLLAYSSRTWSFGPSVSWNIFDAGAIRQNISVQNAIQAQAMVKYKATVLKAQEEVENVIVAYSKEQHRKAYLAGAVAAARHAFRLSMDKYKAGIAGFDDVLETQRTLVSLEDDLLESKGNVAMDLVRLYKALGGGWRYLKQK